MKKHHSYAHIGLAACTLIALNVCAQSAWRASPPQADPPLTGKPPIVLQTEAASPPWRYGRADARFTITEYADLECPYCRAYYPVLRHWIDTHPEVALQWHHLPLAMHEPAASVEARLAECAGQTGGNHAFWQAVTWIYEHTHGDGQGVPPALRYPGRTPAVDRCLQQSDHPSGQRIRAQADQAAREGIVATPTLRLTDRRTGKTLTVTGLLEGDALSSAFDLLLAHDDAPKEGAL